MKHGFHTKHFLGGWRTFIKQPLLLVVAPIASLVGLGALIDSVLYILGFALIKADFSSTVTTSVTHMLPPDTIGPTLRVILSDINIAILVLVLVAISIVCQVAVVHTTYKHSKSRKKVKLRHAFDHAWNKLIQTALLHIAAWGAIAIVVIAMNALLVRFDSLWVSIPSIVLGALLVLAVLTIKMLALQLVAGAGKTMVESVEKAVKMTISSPLAVIEHNLILFAVNAVALVVLLFAVQLLSFLASLLGVAFILVFDNQVIGGIIEIVVFVLASLFVAGVVTSFNMATWSHFTKSLEKRKVPTAFKRFLKTYLAIS